MRKLLFFLSVLFLFLEGFSKELYFDHLTVEDGLSGSFVKTIYTDHYGYVWFGTQGGIDRFDGKEVRGFNNYFPNGIKSVTSFTEDINKNLWIGSEGGLYIWDRLSSKFTSIPLDRSGEFNITRINCYNEAKLFVGTDIGFFLVNTLTHAVHPIPFHKDSNHLLNYITDFIIEDDQIYISSKGGLVQYNVSLNSTTIYSSFKNQSPLSQSYSCITKNNDDIFLGHGTRGLIRFSLDSQQVYEMDAFKDYQIVSLQCNNDNLYVGTNSHGLKILDKESEKVQHVEHFANIPNSISSNTISSIRLDQGGTIWIGTYAAGVSYSSSLKSAFNAYLPNDTDLFRNKSIRSLWFDEHNNKLIGTRNGLYAIDRYENISYFPQDGKKIRSKNIITLYKYKDEVLIGTYGGGISSYSFTSNQVNLWKDDWFHNQSIYTFDEDKQGNLWIGGFDGLFMVSKSQRIIHFTKENSIFQDPLVYYIKIDHKGRIWIGGRGGASVYKYENDVLKLVGELEFGAPDVKVLYFHIDSSNKMWVGTVKYGAFQFDMELKMIKNITQHEGLCSNSVASIIEAQPDEIWISTLNGLTLYNNKRDLCYNYYSADLPGPTYCRGASVKDFDGNIWLGNEKGLVYFNHEEIIQDKPVSNIRITDIYLGGKPISEVLLNRIETPIEEVGFIELPGQYNDIGFRFVDLISLPSPKKKYLVNLEGRDTTWNNLNNKNSVYYNMLKPGEYIFQVGVSDETGSVVQNSIRTVSIRIKPVWHRSSTTIIIVISVLFALIFALAYLFIMYRKRIKTSVEIQADTKDKYESSRLDITNSKSLLDDIKKHVEESEAFLRSDLKISHISKEMDISVHDISQSINQNLDQGFTDFINGYRVDKFKQRLIDSDYEKYTLMAIAESCGFNSKSSFNRAFKKITGQTPSEYLSKTGNQHK